LEENGWSSEVSGNETGHSLETNELISG